MTEYMWDGDTIGIPDKVVAHNDPAMPNACTFVIHDEGHTLGNLLRTYLHLQPNVIMAGYLAKHPMTHSMHLQVATNTLSNPKQATLDAIDAILEELTSVETALTAALDGFPRQH